MNHFRLLILTLLIVTQACGYRNQSTENADKASPTASNSLQEKSSLVLKGSDVYIKNCKFCHGGEGHGDGVKARLSDGNICPFDLSKEQNPDDVICQIIKNGKGNMPAQTKLTEEQIKELLVFIKSFTS